MSARNTSPGLAPGTMGAEAHRVRMISPARSGCFQARKRIGKPERAAFSGVAHARGAAAALGHDLVAASHRHPHLAQLDVPKPDRPRPQHEQTCRGVVGHRVGQADGPSCARGCRRSRSRATQMRWRRSGRRWCCTANPGRAPARGRPRPRPSAAAHRRRRSAVVRPAGPCRQRAHRSRAGPRRVASARPAR